MYSIGLYWVRILSKYSIQWYTRYIEDESTITYIKILGIPFTPHSLLPPTTQIFTNQRTVPLNLRLRASCWRANTNENWKEMTIGNIRQYKGIWTNISKQNSRDLKWVCKLGKKFFKRYSLTKLFKVNFPLQALWLNQNDTLKLLY